VENLQTLVQFAANENRYSELVVGENLKKLFVRFKRQYDFFADIGVIDMDGIQQVYVGPYDLQGTDYSNDTWFRETLVQGFYISKIYLGYRQVPHFTIAVSKTDPETLKPWVLRVTIDSTQLQKIVDTIKASATEDLFLTDQDGYLQTSSSIFGEVLSKYESGASSVNEISGFSSPADYFNIEERVGNTPWSLVLVEKRYAHHEDWLTFRRNLIFIVLSCISISLAIIFTLINLLVDLIRRSDEIWLNLLQETEHNDRLASIGRLAAGVGHEINNPLAIINEKAGLVEDLLEVTPNFEHKETILGCLSVVGQCVDRCKTITHRLLGFARRQDAQMQEVKVNEVIKEVMTFLNSSMIKNKIEVDLQLLDDLPPVTSDHQQLQQVFLNILNNAIDAVGTGGTISVKTYSVAGNVRVVIQDDGPGIDEKHLPHIFEPFFTTKESGKGTGLGLSITYGILKKLGGDISVRSQVGKGTAFTITI
jgi:two-component system NtrC family sensor kinase